MSKTMEHLRQTIVRPTIISAHSWPTWVRTAVTHCVTMASESPATCEARMVQADDDEEEVLFQSDDAVGPSCNPQLLDTGTTETEQVLFDAATEANTPSEDTRDEDLQEADATDGQLGPCQGLGLPVLGSARLPFNALAAAKYCYQVASRGGLESTTVPPQLRRLMYLRWFGVVRGQTPRDWLNELRPRREEFFRYAREACLPMLPLGFCLLVAWAALGKAEDVVTLTGSDFDQHLKDNKYVLAEFYAPWCGHCKKLAPEYEKAAQALKFSGVSLAKVDATEEKDLAKKYDVKGFPTLIWFEEGKQMEYSGGRTTQTIIDWASSMTGPAVLENSDPAPPGRERPRVVLQASSLDSVFEQVAKDHRRKATWYFQKTGGPSKVILQHAGEDPVELSGALENATLTQFVLDNALPLVGELNADTFDKYLEAGKGLVWSLFPVKAGEGFEEHRGIMTDVGKRFRGKYFVTHTDTAKFKEAIDNMLGITKFPAIAVQKKAGDKKKFVYTGAMTAAQISQFVEDVSTGKVPPSLKSEPKPAANDDAVRVVVGSTFEQEVFTPDKDVLLEVYAPWCGHCKKLEPEYSKLAKKIKKEELGDLLSIAKIDGTANDSPVDSIDWSSFPTIFFVKAGQSNATVYDGERTAKGLWKYIRKHATKAQELRERLERRKGNKGRGFRRGAVDELLPHVPSHLVFRTSPEAIGPGDRFQPDRREAAPALRPFLNDAMRVHSTLPAPAAVICSEARCLWALTVYKVLSKSLPGEVGPLAARVASYSSRQNWKVACVAGSYAWASDAMFEDEDEDRQMRQARVEVLSFLERSPTAERHSKALASVLQREDPKLCSRAIRLLKGLGAAAAEQVAPLLGDEDARFDCIDVLQSLGSAAQQGDFKRRKLTGGEDIEYIDGIIRECVKRSRPLLDLAPAPPPDLDPAPAEVTSVATASPRPHSKGAHARRSAWRSATAAARWTWAPGSRTTSFRVRAPGQLSIALPWVTAAFLNSCDDAAAADACRLSDMACRYVDTALLHAHAHAIRTAAFCGLSADAIQLTRTSMLDFMEMG
eukprot:s513_g6.t2